MRTVIITGAGGLIGSEAVEFFCKKAERVVGIDNNARSYFFGPKGDTADVSNHLSEKYSNYYIADYDIRDQPRLETLFNHYNNSIDLIIHLSLIHI